VVSADQPMPKLPVAQALWAPKPSFETACACWIYAGGAHHTGFSQSVTTEMLTDFAAIADIECLRIGEKADVEDFKNELRWNDLYYALHRGC
jgi:L-arabinose isomerase